jgi:uncharacterized membrane protein YeaQ/YmgE (transglycosylase-associated protein family)
MIPAMISRVVSAVQSAEPILQAALFWIVVGGIAGWLASLVARTNRRMGCLLNIAVGVVGAIIGGWIFRNLGLRGPAGHPVLGSIIIAFVGATVLLLILRLLASLGRGW